jgi:beta-glucosidase
MSAWIDRVPALLQSWYPGQEGGTALAQLLFGETSPSGKLPVSFERRFEDNAVHKSYYADPPESKKVKYSEGVFVGYRHFDRSGTKPLFPFGYGLSYTSFTYDHLTISPQSGNLDTPISVIFEVTNTGSREGAEVAEVYVGDSHAAVPRPVKELKGFARINLKPGQTQRVMLTLDRRAFSYYDVQGKSWKADPGEFTILVGGSSDNTPLKGTFTLAH